MGEKEGTSPDFSIVTAQGAARLCALGRIKVRVPNIQSAARDSRGSLFKVFGFDEKHLSERIWSWGRYVICGPMSDMGQQL